MKAIFFLISVLCVNLVFAQNTNAITCKSNGSIENILKVTVMNSDVSGLVEAQVMYRTENNGFTLKGKSSKGSMNDSQIAVSDSVTLVKGKSGSFNLVKTLNQKIVATLSVTCEAVVVE